LPPAELKKLTAAVEKPALKIIPLWLEKAFFKSHLKGKYKPGRVLSSKSHECKASKAWLALAFQTIWGTAFPDDHHSTAAQKTRADKSSWYDNGIAATAAYSAYLLTLDKALIWKCERLKNAGIVNFAVCRPDKVETFRSMTTEKCVR